MTIQKIASLTAEPDDFGISVDACEASERWQGRQGVYRCCFDMVVVPFPFIGFQAFRYGSWHT